MFYIVPFKQLYFVYNWDVVKEPVKKEADLPKNPKDFKQVIFIIKQNFNKFLVLYNAFKKPKKFPGIFNWLYIELKTYEKGSRTVGNSINPPEIDGS